MNVARYLSDALSKTPRRMLLFRRTALSAWLMMVIGLLTVLVDFTLWTMQAEGKPLLVTSEGQLTTWAYLLPSPIFVFAFLCFYTLKSDLASYEAFGKFIGTCVAAFGVTAVVALQVNAYYPAYWPGAGFTNYFF